MIRFYHKTENSIFRMHKVACNRVNFESIAWLPRTSSSSHVLQLIINASSIGSWRINNMQNTGCSSANKMKACLSLCWTQWSHCCQNDTMSCLTMCFDTRIKNIISFQQHWIAGALALISTQLNKGILQGHNNKVQKCSNTRWCIYENIVRNHECPWTQVAKHELHRNFTRLNSEW